MAAPLIVYATRTWAEMVLADVDADMEGPAPPLGPDDPTTPASPFPETQPPCDYACLAVDSKNAYGSILRSVMLRGARLRSPRIASRQATQWSRPTTAWVKLEGAWTRVTTQRGGWQGSHLMMNMFALGLEEAFEPREHLLTDLGIARLGYADDLHLYGKVEALERKWPFIVGILGSAPGSSTN